VLTLEPLTEFVDGTGDLPLAIASPMTITFRLCPSISARPLQQLRIVISSRRSRPLMSATLRAASIRIRRGLNFTRTYWPSAMRRRTVRSEMWSSWLTCRTDSSALGRRAEFDTRCGLLGLPQRCSSGQGLGNGGTALPRRKARSVISLAAGRGLYARRRWSVSAGRLLERAAALSRLRR